MDLDELVANVILILRRSGPSSVYTVMRTFFLLYVFKFEQCSYWSPQVVHSLGPP